MGRLPLGALPKMSRHPSGQARVRVGREEHWLGRFGSPEAQRRYYAIIRRIIDQGNGSVVPAAPPVAVEPEAAPENASAATCTDAAIAAPPADASGAGESAEASCVTVAEVCSRFLRYAEREYRDATGRPTSTIGNYKMAVRALRPYDDVSANAFNAPLFKDMIQRLVSEERPARSEGKPPQRWPRQTINRIAKSVRFIFKWAVTEELVSADVLTKLGAVRLLARNRTTAPDLPP
jgi:hypothetical protein